MMFRPGNIGHLGRLGLVAAAARALFNPASLFANGEQGAWYDPSDLSTLFQDSAGTTPVTAVEQPVGLMLDKRLGLVLGPELVTNGTFESGIGGWSTVPPAAATWTGSALQVTRNPGAAFAAQPATQINVEAGRSYRVSLTVATVPSSGVASLGIFGSDRTTERTTPGTVSINTATGFSFVFRASITEVAHVVCGLASTVSGTVTFDNISVRELPGNHAFQTTAIDRPILRNRYNLLTKTEQFDDAAWTKVRTDITPNAIIAPDGTLSADLIVRNSTTLGASTQQSITAPIGSRVTLRIRAKAAGVGGFFGLCLQGTYPDRADVLFNLSDGTFAAPASTNFTSVSVPPAIDLGSGWWELSLTATVANSALDRIAFGPSAGGSVTTWEGASTTLSNAYVWGASLVQADQASLPYQRVNTATDYDSDPSKFPLYLSANGTNTWMQTNSIDFTGTDKVTVFAGVRKLSDAAAGCVAELSADSASNNGVFLILGPGAVGQPTWLVRSRGSSFAQSSIQPVSAPDTSVITLAAEISTDRLIARRNSVQVTSSTTDQGTGNYGNYPLYLFRRGGTNLPFNGNFYGLLIRGALTSDAQTIAMERWLAPKTGVTIP